MMRAVSIRLKVTIWYTLLVAVLALFAIFSVALVHRRVSLDYYRQTLENTAALSLDDISYVNGDIDIDRNLDDMANVGVAVYDLSGDLIYGKTRFETPFDSSDIRPVTDRAGGNWYVKDTLIAPEGGAEVWLRLYIASDASDAMNSGSMIMLMALAPVLVLLAAVGGWLITKAAFKPVMHIARTAQGIMDGRDLKKRVALPAARDEIYRLASVIDTMLERLDASFERERRFTSDAAHELRTPIAAILAQSQSALDADDDELRRAVLDISRRAKGMSALVGELLALTRMDAGRTPVNLEMMDISEICRAVAEITGARAQINALGDCRVLCDQSMITRAVLNLVENAMRYAGAEARIEMDITGSAADVAVAVRDNGPGISEKDMEHIFERFYQGDRARSGSGSGLGLAMVEQIALLHGGGVTVKNDGGAVFTVTLPRRRDEA
jgi:signal transduction histidine kinase